MYITIDGGYMDANISLTRSTEDFLLRFPRDGLDHHFGARTRDTFLANVPKKKLSCYRNYDDRSKSAVLHQTW